MKTKIRNCRRITGYALAFACLFHHIPALISNTRQSRIVLRLERTWWVPKPLCVGNDRQSMNENDDTNKDHSESSCSKEKAISALSQPLIKGSPMTDANKDVANSIIPPLLDTPTENKRKSKRTTIKKKRPRHDFKARKTNVSSSSKSDKLKKQEEKTPETKRSKSGTFSSLLPPPMPQSKFRSNNSGTDALSSGLSSWEEFLTGSSESKYTGTSNPKMPGRSSNRKSSSVDVSQAKLPAIEDLFPPDISSTNSTSTRASLKGPSKSVLDGVLPVSDLFYRSSRAKEEHDDEELPFSAEQTDSISSDDNRVRIRRNLAQTATTEEMTRTANQKKRGRKMVRRGMEMLVGGIPINADPPQRNVELNYDESSDDWAGYITLNTPLFGPLLYAPTVPKVSKEERGLFCEYFCHSALKWDICPKDLRDIIKVHTVELHQRGQDTMVDSTTPDIQATGADTISPLIDGIDYGDDDNSPGAYNAENLNISTDTDLADKIRSKRGENDEETSSDFKGFGKEVKRKKKTKTEQSDIYFVYCGGTEYEVDLTVSELNSSEEGTESMIVRDVTTKALNAILRKLTTNMKLVMTTFDLQEQDNGCTKVSWEFGFENLTPNTLTQVDQEVETLLTAFRESYEDELGLALAAAARDEKRWPAYVRQRFIEECLYQNNDVDEPVDLSSSSDDEEFGPSDDSNDDEYEIEADEEDHSDDILYPSNELYIGGSSGIYFDYSLDNSNNSPYGGRIGLRLVDAVIERAKQRQPRVIAIGDVHGCIDELQDLLRECDYRPGDLVVFLGDLVCKGPDSISVVQMAREIGAVGVRGNVSNVYENL